MAGRGRGGGGGGRGRGRTPLSFNPEQLGLAPGEILPGPVLQPPPLFPTLEFRPAPLLDTPFHVSQLQLKADFHDFFTRSSSFIKVAPSLPAQNEQFTDACQKTVVDKPFVTDWMLVPPELRPNSLKKKRKAGTSGGAAKKVYKENITNLNSWLEELEKKESIEEVKEKEPGDGESDKKKKEEEQEGDPNDELEEEDIDEEMDDGTDYNQNYFDNGEGYLDDEDDNLDDGPIY